MHLFFLLTILLSIGNFAVAATENSMELPPPVKGKDLGECSKKLKTQNGGWCEIRQSERHPSISSVWPDKIEKKTRMRTGPGAILRAWNSAAFDSLRYKMYFMGGGHADYGGNEVYEFDLNMGKWSRLTDSSPLNFLFIAADYNTRKKKKKPWRRLCWTPDARKVPGSAHTYDGLIYSKQTKTIFLYDIGAANGACMEDVEDKYRNSPLVLGKRHATRGWYEFNPDPSKSRNGMSPLTWRRVFDVKEFQLKGIHKGYPASVELPNGDIVFGSRLRTQRYNPKIADISSLVPFTAQADWGDGIKIYDKRRDIIWSLHNKALLAFSGANGKLLQKYEALIPHGKSLAVGGDGKLYSWNGIADVLVFDPDGAQVWKTLTWGAHGPSKGSRTVYGKWIYLRKERVFVGLSYHKTGVWVYKHPVNAQYIEYSKHNAQKLVRKAKPGSTVIIPPGVYPTGLFINKSLTVGLKGVSLRGVSKRKGIINVACNGCRVVIEDFHGDGRKANCQSGNCAGVKAAGKDFSLTLRRAHIDGAVMGVITDNRGGELILEDSLIENSGWQDRSKTLGHGVYAGSIDRVVVKNSTIRRSFGSGHLFKSRAADTLIERSVIAGLDGHHSRTIDFPCGGSLIVKDSVLQHGSNAENLDLISVGTEFKACRELILPSKVVMTGNWILIDRDKDSIKRGGTSQLFTWRAPVESVKVIENIFVETTGHLKFDGEGRIPDMSDQNFFYSNRREVGLIRGTLPVPGRSRPN